MTRFAGLAVLLLLAGCGQQTAQAPAPAAAQTALATCPTGTANAVRYELYLGGSVSAKDFNEFVDAEVTPRFPRGFTVVDAHGQWQESDGQISKEESRILIVVAGSNVVAQANISAIGSGYNERFDQESALLAESTICAGQVGSSLPD